MKIMMVKMMMLSSTIITSLSNPMSMGTTLLIQTIFMTMLMNKMSSSAWFSMMTFLMMIGGLLILFTYMSSMASNEKFKTNINLTMTLIIMLTLTEEMLNENQIKENQNMIELFTNEKLSMIKLYNKKSMLLTMMMVMYLLITMISITKIVKHHEGPLRSKN